ncbi:MAG TPA: Hsp70 family protein [Actinophytocola sp.]|jgi:molecular chaperone DnaK (HSP70)|uniref:Hsp70 family protein n=1 Tax=Actinophytocola sp. TaxID=1872138 RepID=UPI002E054376|nr:Hsp70 family protein [Actinophytocola sp.]
MPYVLGVDVGSGHTTAALNRHDEDEVWVLPLDAVTPSVHSVLYLTDDDAVLVGRDALARAEAEPDRVARGFVDRIGDPVPPLVGGRPCPAEVLTAALVCWVVDRAAEIEGDGPERVVLTHPASWGPHRRALLDGALRQAGLPDVLLLPKPVAAAETHAAGHPVAAGDAVAVCDLGEHTGCGAVTHLGPAGFELVSRAEAGEHVAGARFDDALVAHVLAELERAPADLDPEDEDVRAVLAELRAACRTAKETLSSATEAVVPTPLLGPPSSVLIPRSRFEELIAPAVHRTVDMLLQAIRAAGGARVTAVTLVGGSARVPLVAELVMAASPVRVVVDADPATAVARGAALAARRAPDPSVRPVRLPEQREHVDPDAPTQPPRPPVEVAPLDVPLRGARRWRSAGRARRRAG